MFQTYNINILYSATMPIDFLQVLFLFITAMFITCQTHILYPAARFNIYSLFFFLLPLYKTYNIHTRRQCLFLQVLFLFITAMFITCQTHILYPAARSIFIHILDKSCYTLFTLVGKAFRPRDHCLERCFAP